MHNTEFSMSKILGKGGGEAFIFLVKKLQGEKGVSFYSENRHSPLVRTAVWRTLPLEWQGVFSEAYGRLLNMFSNQSTPCTCAEKFTLRVKNWRETDIFNSQARIFACAGR